MIYYLLTAHRGQINLYSPNTYGHETWSSNSQDSIIKKRKHWYFSYWSAGYGDYFDDVVTEYKMNVILEAKSLFSIIAYTERNYPNQLTHILEQALEISKANDLIEESIKKYENRR